MSCTDVSQSGCTSHDTRFDDLLLFHNIWKWKQKNNLPVFLSCQILHSCQRVEGYAAFLEGQCSIALLYILCLCHQSSRSMKFKLNNVELSEFNSYRKVLREQRNGPSINRAPTFRPLFQLFRVHRNAFRLRLHQLTAIFSVICISIIFGTKCWRQGLCNQTVEGSSTWFGTRTVKISWTSIRDRVDSISNLERFRIF